MGRLLAGWMRANRPVPCGALRRMTVYRVGDAANSLPPPPLNLWGDSTHSCMSGGGVAGHTLLLLVLLGFTALFFIAFPAEEQRRETE